MVHAMVRKHVERCIEEFQKGELTEVSLRRVLDSLEETPPRRQDLLYLQAGSTSLHAGILGMSLFQNGKTVDGLADPKDWPYKNVLEAVRDGWRVIQFPNMALMMDDTRTYGLGCEFILERWSENP
ncbi:MAG: hypothetical protein HYU36_15520 [Planctomycetes bacterium]|nr:hypothetical protein [Planctomycetota bacterium]